MKRRLIPAMLMAFATEAAVAQTPPLSVQDAHEGTSVPAQAGETTVTLTPAGGLIFENLKGFATTITVPPELDRLTAIVPDAPAAVVCAMSDRVEVPEDTSGATSRQLRAVEQALSTALEALLPNADINSIKRSIELQHFAMNLYRCKGGPR